MPYFAVLSRRAVVWIAGCGCDRDDFRLRSSWLHGVDHWSCCCPCFISPAFTYLLPHFPRLPGYSLYGMVANQLGDVDSLMELPPGSVRGLRMLPPLVPVCGSCCLHAEQLACRIAALCWNLVARSQRSLPRRHVFLGCRCPPRCPSVTLWRAISASSTPSS